MGEPSWCGLCRCPPTVLWAMSGGTASDVSFTKRAAQELSRCFNGLSVGRAAKGSQGAPAFCCPGSGALNETQHLLQRARITKGKFKERLDRVPHARTLTELWLEPAFLARLFKHVSPKDRAVLAQVCTAWREVLYQPKFWRGIQPIINFRELKSSNPSSRLSVYKSLDRRSFDSLCLFGASDDDVSEFVHQCPPSMGKRVRQIALRCSGVTDKGLEELLKGFPSIVQLELSGCNEITDAALWASLSPRIVSLTLADCIHVSDDTVAAVTQLLPSLYELDLQAYHVTDAALSLLCLRDLRVLRLRSCWELTDRGLMELARSLPDLTQLSLSGCSKISDEGVSLLAENMRQLRALDLGWCPRISDGALEYIACDLSQLEELTLDRKIKRQLGKQLLCN
ncbi:F-box/LRR-repeat protein 16-like isoform X2 [Uloborus diversus]|uniref:F-box/LRR-repeat protein 16-like isoform X2 n=1 Tax=Uloborus diversus TaxID=327109 RepID=UPI00240A8307|nr:F-box/LRR-repeat protein 16-like isoform X2 [Uloborus diversus]